VDGLLISKKRRENIEKPAAFFENTVWQMYKASYIKMNLNFSHQNQLDIASGNT